MKYFYYGFGFMLALVLAPFLTLIVTVVSFMLLKKYHY